MIMEILKVCIRIGNRQKGQRVGAFEVCVPAFIALRMFIIATGSDQSIAFSGHL